MISMPNSVVKVDQIISQTEEAGVKARIKHKTRYMTMLTSSRIS